AEVGMVAAGDTARCRSTPRAPQGLQPPLVRHDFDRNGAIEPRVGRLVDVAHSAAPDGRDDHVGAEAGAGGENGHQNARRIASCRNRGSAAVRKRPKLPEFREWIGLARLTSFSALNTSNRSCAFQPACTGSVFSTPRSSVREAGPRYALRPVLP